MTMWFIKPEEVQLDLVYNAPDGSSHPFWVKVKKFLTVGEQRRIMTAGWRGMRSAETGGNEIQIDWRAQTFARTEVYLTGWSLSGGTPTRESIESLDANVFAVIEDAITQHIQAVIEEKKLPAGTPLP